MKGKSIYNWTRELASGDGKYGGGSAASVVGALAVSLAQFVFELQQGKQKYAAHEQEIAQAIDRAEQLNTELLDLAEEDAVAFEPVLDLFKLPQDTEEECVYRRAKIDEGLAEAVRPPFQIMKKMDTVASLFEQLLKLDIRGSIVNDIVVGLIFAQATIDSEVRNCFINIDAIHDKKRREDMTETVNEVYDAINARITSLKEEAMKLVDR
jgi:formiminotetrahydrofolate cyclodeaminase